MLTGSCSAAANALWASSARSTSACAGRTPTTLEEEQRAGRLRRLELVEAREGDRVLAGCAGRRSSPAAATRRPGSRRAPPRSSTGARARCRASTWRSAKPRSAMRLHRGQQQLLGRELEVDGALRQDAVLELERPRVPRQDVRQDAFHLHPRGVAQLPLVDEAALGEHLRERSPRADLRVHLVELLARDPAALDQDRAELVPRVVRGAEQDPAAPEVERLRDGSAR